MRRNLPAQPAPLHYFGGLKPTGVIGADGFLKHDASTTWDDGGKAAQLAEDITQALRGLSESLKNYGAEQARDAVYDYMSDAYVDMALIDGRVSIVMDASNDTAQFRVHWDLESLINRVVQDALDQDMPEIVDAVHTLCERTTLMLSAAAAEPEQAPVEQPEPVPVAVSRVIKRQTLAAPQPDVNIGNGRAGSKIATQRIPTPRTLPQVRRTPRG